MSTTVKEKFDNRTGNANAQWRRGYQRVFYVDFDSPFYGPKTVIAALPVAIGQKYALTDITGSIIEKDDGAFVQSIDVRVSSEDGCQWEATVTYGPYDANQQPQNPIDWPLQITHSFAKFESIANEDIDGNAILNSADDYFDPPVTRDDSRPVMRIARNEATFDPATAYQFKDAVNKATFFGADPGTVKCADISADLIFNPDIGWYYSVSYEFEYNPDGWEKQILDQGLKYLDSTGSKVPVTEKGIPATSPVLLDGNGAQLAAGADPVFLKFKVYPEEDFDSLNLDPKGQPGQPE
jgi:hypothetical protein